MDWNRGATIGRGSFATVSIATSTATDEIFAVKSVELIRSSFLQREKEILSQLSSPHIVQYRGDQITIENNVQIYNLFMEFAPHGTISELVRKNGGSIDESTIRTFAHQILLGLDYLHDNGIVHCDIKGQNLLIGNDGIKIADLGCAKRVGATSAISGTPSFMAPEVARGEEQSFPSDVWALGCAVIEMATGSHPFQNEECPVSVLYRVGFCGEMPETPLNLTKTAKDFLNKCLERDSKTRWTAKELLWHPFFDDLSLNSPNFDDIIRVSPTSALDQGFWDSIEVPDSGPNSAHVSTEPISPIERIKKLIRSSNPNIPNWDCDEEWIDIRADEDQESSESAEIEPIFESQEFGTLISDSVDTIGEYYDDVLFFLDCVSLDSDTDKFYTYLSVHEPFFLMLGVNFSDDTYNVSSELERKSMKFIFLYQFKRFKFFTIRLYLLTYQLTEMIYRES